MRRRLGAEVERLRPVGHDVVWVAPDNFHLTLKFLGGVEAARLDAVTQVVAEAAAAGGAFDLVLRGLGAYPSPTRPRVLWAGIDEGARPAAALAARVDEALQALGFERETRPFSPHITLGRVRQPHAQPRLATALAVGGDFGRVRVSRVALMRSDLSPRGARYSELATAPLGRENTG